MNPRRWTTGAMVALCALATAGRPARGLEPTKEAVAAYESYLKASEARMEKETASGPFLFVDGWPTEERAEALARLGKGGVETREMDNDEAEKVFEAHGALVHDWMGLVFIPHATLAETLAVVQDYKGYETIYKPGMRHSKLVSRNGDTYDVALQLYRKAIVGFVVNARFEISYQYLGGGRAASHARATRLAEVTEAGKADEHELPPGESHGLLWALNDYWRFEEKDGGVYVQLETIELSRSVPSVVAWLVNPLIKTVPRGILSGLLGATRAAVLRARQAGEAPDDERR